MSGNLWYVSYKIPKMTGDKVHIAGPFASRDDANEQTEDIGGYEGVTNLRTYSENPSVLLEKYVYETQD